MGQTNTRRITSKSAEEKLAHKRLSVLQLPQALGSVSKAYRHSGMNRTSFYEWKRRFQTHALEGLKILPPVHKYHPQTTPPKIEEKILTEKAEHPRWACVKLSDRLKPQGFSVPSSTIQNILIKHKPGSRYEPLLKLKERHLSEGISVSPEQVEQIEKSNPCFRERHVESSSPSELLCQDTFYVGRLNGGGRVYLQAVVDTYASSVFGLLHTDKLPECAVTVLHNEVLPFYRERQLPVKAVLSDNDREYCGTPAHFFELYLTMNDIEHRRTKARSLKTNGFVERFNATILDEFFRKAFHEQCFESVEALQKALDAWLHHYNTERPHLDYRNMGRRPMETINLFPQPARQEDELDTLCSKLVRYGKVSAKNDPPQEKAFLFLLKLQQKQENTDANKR